MWCGLSILDGFLSEMVYAILDGYYFYLLKWKLVRANKILLFLILL